MYTDKGTDRQCGLDTRQITHRNPPPCSRISYTEQQTLVRVSTIFRGEILLPRQIKCTGINYSRCV